MGNNRYPIIRKNKFIIKHYKKDCIGFRRELKFYLDLTGKLNFIPKLYGYSISQKKIIIENVGKIPSMDFIKENIDVINKYEYILKIFGYYHNDIRRKNITFHNERFYLIDFEMSDTKFTDKNKGKGDKKNFIY